MFIIVVRKQISQVVYLGKLPGYVVRKMNVSELLLGLARHMTMSRVFVWGRRPDVSSGRFSFHVRFFDTNIWEFYFYCPFSFNILLLEENLSELQSSLRNAGNGVPECSILKISWGGGGIPPDPPRCLHLRRSQGALWRQDKFHMRCFHNHVRYFTKLLKTLHEVLLENTLSLSCSSPKGANFTFSFILYVKLEELLYKYGKRTRDFWAFLLAYLSSFYV